VLRACFRLAPDDNRDDQSYALVHGDSICDFLAEAEALCTGYRELNMPFIVKLISAIDIPAWYSASPIML
jgi:hypothetical protein